jgi:hypothetical protein
MAVTIPQLYDRAFECHHRGNEQADRKRREEWTRLTRRFVWMALNSIAFELNRPLPRMEGVWRPAKGAQRHL